MVNAKQKWIEKERRGMEGKGKGKEREGDISEYGRKRGDDSA